MPRIAFALHVANYANRVATALRPAQQDDSMAYPREAHHSFYWPRRSKTRGMRQFSKPTIGEDTTPSDRPNEPIAPTAPVIQPLRTALAAADRQAVGYVAP